MRRVTSIRLLVRALFRRRAVEHELDAELQFYVDERIARHQAAGLTRGEAERAAQREVGSVMRIKEGCRDSWRTNLLDDLARDIRGGWRNLVRARGFTAVAVATLALGIGTSTAMFSQVNAVFLTALPVDRPGDLRLLDWTTLAPDAPRRYNTSSRLSHAAYRAVRDHATMFSNVACWSGAFVNYGTGERQGVPAHSDRLETHVVSGSYFATLGVAPRLGRTIDDEDERRDARVAVISFGLWQRAFGGRDSVIGTVMPVNGERVEIVGVLPRRFIGLNPARAADLYLPLSMYSLARFDAAGPRRLDNDQDWSACEVVARLRPGASDDAAAAQAERLVAGAPFAGDRGSGPLLPLAGGAAGRAGAAPDAEARTRRDAGAALPRLRLVPASHGTDDLRVDTSQPLALLMVATLLVLLVACANVAGLLLARIPARTGEIATRLALGASRRRVVRQLLVETLMLSSGAGLLGVALAFALNRLVPGLLGSFVNNGADIARVEAVIDLRVLLFAIAVAIVTGVGFGLAPAAVATRIDFSGVASRANAGAARLRRPIAGRVLVCAQVALALLLLIEAGLLIRTSTNLRAATAARPVARQLHFAASPGQTGYRGVELRQWFQTVLMQLDASPDIASASGLGAGSACVIVDSQNEAFALAYAVGPRYFSTTGTTMVAGRDFTWQDREGALPVAIVNRAFADRFFAGRAAAGRELRFCRNVAVRTIVGVVDNERENVRADVRPVVYIPFIQPPPSLTGNIISFTVRTHGDAAGAVPEVRRAAARVDAAVPIFDVETGVDRRDRTLTRERLLSALVSVYSVVALFFACLGIYGVLAYTVSRRTPEIGVRIALGAGRVALVAMVVRESLAAVVPGVALGIGAAAAAQPWITGHLFGVSPVDPWTIAAAALLFLATGALAASQPARRAVRIDPTRALRYE